MSDPVPAIAEASATGAVAEIFADIRRVLGVEVVNLIWRHLATIPNALPWAWGMLRPLYARGTIAAEAHVLHDRLSLPRLPPFPPDLLYAIELYGGDVVSIRNILAAYDGARRIVGAALPAGGAAWDKRADSRTRSGTVAGATCANSITTVARSRHVVGVDGRSRANPQPARHATGRSRRRCRARPATRHRLARTKRGCRWSRRRHRPDVWRRGFGQPPLDAATGGAIRAAVEPFAGDVIAKMVVICALLRAATCGPNEERSA